MKLFSEVLLKMGLGLRGILPSPSENGSGLLERTGSLNDSPQLRVAFNAGGPGCYGVGSGDIPRVSFRRVQSQ
jgi:hypothetical protein